MGSEWRRVQITEVCQLIVDCVNKTAPTVEGPTPFKMIRTPNVRGGRVSTDDCRFVEKDTFTTWTRRADVRFNDVILTREAPLGEVGIIKSQESLFLGQRLMQYRADPSVLDPDFLVYAFLSEDLQHQFRMHEGSGSVVSHIRVGDCSKFEISIPPLPEQTRIAGVLATIDRKIELNRQMNTTLETMAQVLFKSWFVDFDPVIDNALAAGNPIPDELAARAERRKQLHDRKDASSSEHLTPAQPLPAAIQQQFPDRFVFTEALGWVPEGWSVSEVGAVLDLAYGKSLPARERVHGDIPVFGSGGASGFHNQKLVSGPGIVVGRKGTVGSLYWVEGDFFPIDTVFYVVKKTDIPLYWLYQSLALMDIKSMGADSAVPGVNRNVIYARKTTVPSLNIFKQYAAQVDSYNVRKKALQLQTSALEETRDTLLPKLLSGQLRIPEAEQQVAEII